MDITINRMVFAACVSVIGLTILFGLISVISRDFRADIILVAPAILGPLITLATALAGMYRANKGSNGDSTLPPPRQPEGEYGKDANSG